MGIAAGYEMHGKESGQERAEKNREGELEVRSR